MPTNYKILGQAAPANTSNANLYTVPASTEAIVSTLAIANTNPTSATARVFIRIGGAAAATSNAIVYDTVFIGNSVTTLTLGITLSAGDIITVQTASANFLTFHAFGSEIS
jgi:hypothetical protein